MLQNENKVKKTYVGRYLEYKETNIDMKREKKLFVTEIKVKKKRHMPKKKIMHLKTEKKCHKDRKINAKSEEKELKLKEKENYAKRKNINQENI